jgi:DNA mismatch repair protein MSH5
MITTGASLSLPTMTSYGNNNGTMRAISQDVSRPPSAATGAAESKLFDGRSSPQEATMTAVSVVEEGSQIAFACYDEANNMITIEQSHANGYDTEEMIELFYAATRPNMVLLNNKSASNASLLHILTRPPPQAPPEEEQEEEGAPSQPQQQFFPVDPNSSIPYRLLRTGAFDLNKCKTVILQKLRVIDLLRARPNQQQENNGQFDVPVGHFEASSYHAIASVVDFDSSVLVRALGSLMSFLQSTLFRLEEGNTVTVNSIVQANSSMFMRISSSTLSALHIFATEHHPLLAKGQGHSKEGFSLFSLLDRTKSKLGRQCLRDWMLKPLVDREAIQQRQDGVEMFLRNEFQAPTGVLLTHLEKVGAIDRILLRMSKCQTAGVDFMVLVRSLSAALTICHSLETMFIPKLTALIQGYQGGNETASDAVTFQNYLEFCQSIFQRCYVQSLRDVLARITDIIDEEATIEEKDSVIIKLGFHEELDCAKEKFDSLDTILTDAGAQLIAQYPNLLNVSAVFLHQLGFLVSIHKSQHDYNEETNTFPALPQEFTCVFSNANEAYFKNDLMRELDETIGDVHGFIQDTERMIVSELEEDILDHESDLRGTFNAIAELDCILCFAACADDLNFTRPSLAEPRDRCIQIKNGRHPLQEIIIDGEFVPNDTAIDSRNRVNIITGPNFSGKSCYTRQVGVIVYMAHIGSFVPADKATIAITDQILARISTVETCAVPQSSFQLEMTQMGTILRRATPFSLVLVDEFGKGTSPSSGIAVLTAVLKQFASMKCKVICTTHFLEIFSLNLVRDGVAAMKAFQMQVQIPRTNEGIAKPLFKIQPGVAKSSAGLVCAEKAGVDKQIIGRAKELLGALQSGTQIGPVEEICNPPLDISTEAREALTMFLSVDNWNEASSETLRRLTHHAARM